MARTLACVNDIMMERVFLVDRSVCFQANTRAALPSCPACGQLSGRVHSRDGRSLLLTVVDGGQVAMVERGRPSRREANRQVEGRRWWLKGKSQTKTQRPQAPGHVQPHAATIGAARRHVRPRSATSSHADDTPYKAREDVPAFVELESGGPSPGACRVVGHG